MKITFTKSFTLLLLSVFVFTACSKSSKTKTEYLTDKIWTQTAKGYDYNNNWTIESSENYLASCDKDNIWTFKNSGTLVEDDGAVRCYSATQWSYDWEISSDDKKLIIDNYTYTIKTLDSYTLEVYSDYQGSNGPVRYIRKWVHQ